MTEHTNVFEVKIDQSIPKIEYYKKQLQGITPEAFFVLGGGNREIVDLTGKKTYKTSSYKGKFYPDKTGGAKARPLAALELGQYYQDAKIVTMSHRPKNLFLLSQQEIETSEVPPFSQVLSEDLQGFGVGKERIIENPVSTSTLTEMMEIIKTCALKDWQNAAVITNDYQIERGKKIIDLLINEEKLKLLKNQLQFLFKTGDESDLFNQKWQELENAIIKFKNSNSKIIFVSAENILKKRSPHYETLIIDLMEQNGYKNVVEQERAGNEKIDLGTYSFAQESFREYIFSHNQK
jgi:hypothetical protein